MIALWSPVPWKQQSIKIPRRTRFADRFQLRTLFYYLLRMCQSFLYTEVIKNNYRWTSLFAVNTSRYTGPWVLNSKTNRHIWQKIWPIWSIFHKWKSESANKKTADNEAHLYCLCVSTQIYKMYIKIFFLNFFLIN